MPKIRKIFLNGGNLFYISIKVNFKRHLIGAQLQLFQSRYYLPAPSNGLECGSVTKLTRLVTFTFINNEKSTTKNHQKKKVGF